MTKQRSATTKVLYNADCPVCRREIEHYAKISTRQSLQISFADLNEDAQLRSWGISKDDAARRLHVRKNGALLEGIPAFIALWEEMPQYRWLARVVRLPVVRPVAIWVYDRVLAPALYKWHRRRVRQACKG